MTEELALEELVWDRSAVHAHHRTIRAWASLVNRRRDELLARAGLSVHEDAGFGGSHHLDLSFDLEQRGTLADEPHVRSGDVELTPQIVAFHFELVAQILDLLEGPGVDQRDGRLVRQRTQPSEALFADLLATEDREDSEGFLAEDQRLAREDPHALCLHPVRVDRPRGLFGVES